jgi:glycine amidinotransferase/scyllo-inosamine-4-phosphate amidinotransferase 1
MELQCYHDIVDQAEHYHFMPRNEGMVLDAANVLRLGPDKMLFLESASGNRAAYDWLCRTLPDVEIELCNFYAGVHIDSTIVALNEDTFVVNGSRVTNDTLPRMLRDKVIIMVNEVVAQGFHEYPYASKWIGLNMLSIDPQTVIVDAKQEAMIQTLEQGMNMTVIPLELRHSRTLGGGFHCVTLDLERG